MRVNTYQSFAIAILKTNDIVGQPRFVVIPTFPPKAKRRVEI